MRIIDFLYKKKMKDNIFAIIENVKILETY